MVVLMLIVVFPGGSVVLVLLAVQRSFLVKAKVRGFPSDPTLPQVVLRYVAFCPEPQGPKANESCDPPEPKKPGKARSTRLSRISPKASLQTLLKSRTLNP